MGLMAGTGGSDDGTRGLFVLVLVGYGRSMECNIQGNACGLYIGFRAGLRGSRYRVYLASTALREGNG